MLFGGLTAAIARDVTAGGGCFWRVSEGPAGGVGFAMDTASVEALMSFVSPPWALPAVASNS